ncbi:MAG: DUF1476 domain-containing protein [Alphaproteobacteria bacterium]|nr:DUF1476 domain-containing protein [Alphaproteobacteria bacterium]MBL6940331.1 DUF1476 domain-containing protein [Alphaproteobacteria bacterium]MBL7098211.1 DUF1476 domain-containing protein [Alphaproteobacteria bacterium]
MSGGFKDREKGFESKFAHDEETRFKVMARRNKLLGLWAAEKLGKSGDAAAAYAKDVIAAEFKAHGDEDVFAKVRADLPASVTDAAIRAHMATLLETAAEQVSKEAK